MDTIAFAEFDEQMHLSKKLGRDIAKIVYSYSNLKKERKIYIEKHVSNNSNNCDYLQNIHLKKPTYDPCGCSGRWSQVIKERQLDDDEMFIDSDEYGGTGKGGPCYHRKIVKLRNTLDRQRYLQILQRKEEIKKKIEACQQETFRMEKLLKSLEIYADNGRGRHDDKQSWNSFGYDEAVKEVDEILSKH